MSRISCQKNANRGVCATYLATNSKFAVLRQLALGLWFAFIGVSRRPRAVACNAVCQDFKDRCCRCLARRTSDRRNWLAIKSFANQKQVATALVSDNKLLWCKDFLCPKPTNLYRRFNYMVSGPEQYVVERWRLPLVEAGQPHARRNDAFATERSSRQAGPSTDFFKAGVI